MLDLEQLRRRCSEGEQFRYLFFWGHQPSKDGRITASCLSQWFAASFTIDKMSYSTAEHWMMASKARLFGDDETLQQILSAADPKDAKALGRQVRNFDNEVWTKSCRQLVTQGNVAKFSQNETLRAFLLATEDQVLVEASPYDRIWGIGLKATDEKAKHPATWEGQNLLGFALMDVRAQVSK
ncbi:MAG TPA: NADAR family protein [Gemmataceae bacterium]|nr:NADAR family protein [Gemmataceae bacterium]